PCFTLALHDALPILPVAVLLSGNVTVTVDPGSAVPLIVLSSLVTLFTLGAYGAVSSLTMVFTGSVSLPASSVDVTSNSSPPFKFISLGIVTTYFPSASVSPVAVSPLGNLIVTVVLGSASPVICASSLVTLFTIGGAGAVSSVTVVELGCETLPVASVAVALIVSLPCRFSLSGIVTVKLPSSSAIVSAIAPLGNVILTVAFASTLPVTSVLTLVT